MTTCGAALAHEAARRRPFCSGRFSEGFSETLEHRPLMSVKDEKSRPRSETHVARECHDGQEDHEYEGEQASDAYLQDQPDPDDEEAGQDGDWE